MNELTSNRVLVSPAYRPDVDGLRAVAVSIVILFHAFPDSWKGGFVGVDIFFVISGYLISSIIFGNLDKNNFSIKIFYERRVKRIFPALIVVVTATLAIGWFVLFPGEYKRLGAHVSASSLFVQNLVLWNESGYFDAAAESKPLLHLWSLAIEEQYYIFWPLFLSFVWRKRLDFFRATALLAVLSFAWNIYLSRNNIVADFYAPIARFWELMAGGMLAYVQLYKYNLLKKHKNARSVLGTVLIGLSVILIDKEQPFPGWWATLPTAGTFLIISAGNEALINKKILSRRMLVNVGLVSYPLYLWHWPLLSYMYIVRPESGYKLKLILISASVVLSVATYLYIERPIRHGKVRSPVFYPLIAGMSLVMLAGFAICFGQLDPRLAGIKLKYTEKNTEKFLASNDLANQKLYNYDPTRDKDKKLTIFIGDSHVEQYAERIFRVGNTNNNLNTALFAVSGGCPPIHNVFTDNKKRQGCWESREEALRIAGTENVSTVVVGANWNTYFLDKDQNYYYSDGVAQDALWSEAGKRKGLNALFASLHDLVIKNKKVYLLLGNPVNSEYDPRNYINRLGGTDLPLPNRFAPWFQDQQRLRVELIELAKRAGASVIDPYSALCKGDKCARISEDGMAIFRDNMHFNPEWAFNNASYIDVTLVPVDATD